MHIADASLLALVRERELAADREPGFRLQAFSVYESAALALLMEHPITPRGAESPHVVVIGLGRLGYAGQAGLQTFGSDVYNAP